MGTMEDLGIKRLNNGDSIVLNIPIEMIERSRRAINEERKG